MLNTPILSILKKKKNTLKKEEPPPPQTKKKKKKKKKNPKTIGFSMHIHWTGLPVFQLHLLSSVHRTLIYCMNRNGIIMLLV